MRPKRNREERKELDLGHEKIGVGRRDGLSVEGFNKIRISLFVSA